MAPAHPSRAGQRLRLLPAAGPQGGERLDNSSSPDLPYRLIVEAMYEGAATVSPTGVILEANPRLAAMTGRAPAELAGTDACSLLPEYYRPAFTQLLDSANGGSARGEAELTTSDGGTLPVQVSVISFELAGVRRQCVILTDLSAQRAAERATERASQEARVQDAFLEQAEASAGLGWWISALGAGSLSASPQVLETFGLAPADFDGRTATLRALVHPQDIDAVTAATANALRTSVPLRIEHRIIRHDGTIRWVQQSGIVERDESGVPLRVLGICQDITDRKHAEDQIRAAADYHRGLFEAHPDPLVTIGLDGRITDVNAAAEQMTGYPRADLVGTGFGLFVTDPDLAMAGFQRATDEGTIRDFPLQVRRRDGHLTPILANASVYRGPDGNVAGVFAAARDVTEVQAAEAALRESEQRLGVLFESAPVGIDELSPTGLIVRANPRFCDITGYTAEELAAMPVHDLIYPDDLPADLANVRRLLAGELDSYTMERRFLRKDGKVVWAEVTRALVRDDNHDPLLIVGAARDITAQRQAESELVAAAAYNRTLFEASPDGLATISPDGTITDVNSAIEVATGYPRDTLIGTEFSSHFTDPELARAGYQRVFREGMVRDYPLEVRHRDGHLLPVLYNAAIYHAPDGSVAGVLAAARDITQLRASQAALRESEERFRAIFDQAPVAIDVLTPAGEVVQGNNQFYKDFGYTPDDLPSTQVHDLSHPDDIDADRERMRRVLAGDFDSYRAVQRYLHKDGSVHWFDISRVLVRDQDGDPLEFICTGSDVTSQHEAEAKIRDAAAYNRNLIEASLDPLVTIDADGRLTDVNTAAEHATGYGRADLIGTEFSCYFTEPDRAQAGYEQAFRGETVQNYPLEMRRSDGHVTPVLYNASVYRDAAGEIHGIVAAARDITQIRRTEAALRESRERLSALFEGAPVGIYEMAPSGELAQVNPRFCEITGYTAGELRSMLIQSIVHPEDLDADFAGLRSLLDGEADSYTVEKRYLRKDGDLVWAQVNRAIVRDESGQPLMIVAAVRDVTAQRQAEAEVRTLTAELEARVESRTADLEQANKDLEAFTYSVSHDLRAPLRALSGFSEALLEDYGDRLDETGRGYAGRIQAASERMGALIDDLLHLSRVSRADMSLRPVDLSAEAIAIAGELRSSEPDRRVRFGIAEGIWATADRVLIRSVLQNLLGNAWKFTAHRDDATIEFGTTAADDAQVCCFVKDNGAGFDPTYVGKLFKPFQRLHSSTDFPGTGIGLASVRRIVERHGGRTWARGAVDHGATFYFTLPRTAPAAR